jgi:hypothetical protein
VGTKENLAPLPPVNRLLDPVVYSNYLEHYLVSTESSKEEEASESSSNNSNLIQSSFVRGKGTNVLQLFNNSTDNHCRVIYLQDETSNPYGDYSDLALGGDNINHELVDPVITSTHAIHSTEQQQLNADVFKPMMQRIMNRLEIYEPIENNEYKDFYRGVEVKQGENIVFLGESFFNPPVYDVGADVPSIIKYLSAQIRLCCELNRLEEFYENSYTTVASVTANMALEHLLEFGERFVTIMENKIVQIKLSKENQLIWSINDEIEDNADLVFWDAQKLWSFKPVKVLWPIHSSYTSMDQQTHHTFINIHSGLQITNPVVLINAAAILTRLNEDCDYSLIPSEVFCCIQKVSITSKNIHHTECLLDVHIGGISLQKLKFLVVPFIPVPVFNSKQILNEARRVSIRSMNTTLQQIVDDNWQQLPTLEQAREYYFIPSDITILTTHGTEVRFQWPIYFPDDDDDEDYQTQSPLIIRMSTFHTMLFQLHQIHSITVDIHNIGSRKYLSKHYSFSSCSIDYQFNVSQFAVIEIARRQE